MQLKKIEFSFKSIDEETVNCIADNSVNLDSLTFQCDEYAKFGEIAAKLTRLNLNELQFIDDGIKLEHFTSAIEKMKTLKSLTYVSWHSAIDHMFKFTQWIDARNLANSGFPLKIFLSKFDLWLVSAQLRESGRNVVSIQWKQSVNANNYLRHSQQTVYCWWFNLYVIMYRFRRGHLTTSSNSLKFINKILGIPLYSCTLSVGLIKKNGRAYEQLCGLLQIQWKMSIYDQQQD